jgi:hypothetical protein
MAKTLSWPKSLLARFWHFWMNVCSAGGGCYMTSYYMLDGSAQGVKRGKRYGSRDNLSNEKAANVPAAGFVARLARILARGFD